MVQATANGTGEETFDGRLKVANAKSDGARKERATSASITMLLSVALLRRPPNVIIGERQAK